MCARYDLGDDRQARVSFALERKLPITQAGDLIGLALPLSNELGARLENSARASLLGWAGNLAQSLLTTTIEAAKTRFLYAVCHRTKK